MKSSIADRFHHHIPDLLVGMAIILVLVTGAIHLIDAPDNFSEAAYKGVLFALNGLAAFIAAIGIYRSSRLWGWGLGTLVTGGALVMYVISRTIGLPLIGVDDAWLEPMGVLSLIVEAGFILLAGIAFVRYGLGQPSANTTAQLKTSAH